MIMMEIWLTDVERIDTVCLPDSGTVDLEIGTDTDNDFEMVIPYKDYDQEKYMTEGYLYVPGTEYGGKIIRVLEDTSEKSLIFNGITFRSMLSRKIVQPPSGSDYIILSGDLHECLSDLIGARFGDLVVVPESTTGITVSNYHVDRYINLKTAIDKLLNPYGYRLDINVDGSAEKMHLIISAKPVTDYSEEIEVSQDGNLNFRIGKAVPAYTHMICAGSGDLKDREIVFLDWNNGNPKEITSIPSEETVREFFYDYPNAEDRSSLINGGIDKFFEINKTDTQEVTFSASDDVYEIGDIVGGRSYVTGFTVSEPISQKIVKINHNRIDITYKVGK